MQGLVETNVKGRPPCCGFVFLQIVLISTYWDSDPV